MAQHHDHVHEDGATCCSHHEVQIDRQIVWILAGGMLVLTTTISRLLGLNDQAIIKLPAMVGAILLAVPLFKAAWSEVWSGKVSSSSLAGLALLAAITYGEFEVAGWLAFILVVVGQIVRRTASGAERAISQLIRLTPQIARRVQGDAEVDINISDIKVGDIVRVRAGENLPVDGRIATGRTTINQASLTGEAAPVEVTVGDPSTPAQRTSAATSISPSRKSAAIPPSAKSCS